MVSGHGLPSLRAAVDALVSTQKARDQNVDLEHVALNWRRADRDRCNARAFMVIGLAASAVMNVCFGFSSAVVTLGVIWMINGWFQGMGFPPCARLLTHWFPPKKLATKMSIWNTSHSIGAGLI